MGEAKDIDIKETLLDTGGCMEVAELHERIRQTFGFPAHYGANLDALWDMGRDYIGDADGRQERILIRGAESLPGELRAYFMEKVMPVLRDLEREKANIHFEEEGGKE